MSAEAWNAGFVRCLGVRLFGGKIDVSEQGEPIMSDTILLLFNADHASRIPFTTPAPEPDSAWELLFDTARFPVANPPEAGPVYELEPCSMAVFRSRIAHDLPTI